MQTPKTHAHVARVKTKIPTHWHTYTPHPTDRDRVACAICGLAIPRTFLGYAIEHGATYSETPRSAAEDR